MFVSVISAQDMTPPVITSPARDTSLPCSNSPVVISTLSAWYNAAGFAAATDDSGSYTFEANLPLNQVISIFLNSSDTLCGNTKNVVVSFTAVDPSGNRSLPTSASFSTIDNIGPSLVVPPNVTISCVTHIRDTLINWIRNKGGYGATDVCSNTLTWTRFQYSISQGNTVLQSGGGFINSGPYPTIPDGICSWKLNINFWVADECGNQTVTFGTTSFNVVDNIAPAAVNPPVDITVSCSNVQPPPTLTFLDGCTRTPSVIYSQTSTQDPDTTKCAHYSYVITRTWIAEDACDNTSTYIQSVKVEDISPPVINAQDTLHFYCSHFIPDSIYYVGVMDNCSPVVSFNVAKTIEVPSCFYRSFIEYSFIDVCGNSDTFLQVIEIESDPILFIKQPENQTFNCSDINNYNVLFSEWITQKAGSEATTTCGELLFFAAVPGSYHPDDQNTWPGTHPGTFDTQVCPSLIEGFVRAEVVDFVFYDTCGHIAIRQAVFGLRDTIAPMVSGCRENITIQLPADNCETSLRIPVAAVSDDCTEANSPVVRTISKPILATDPGNPDSPVHPVDFRIGPYNPSGVFPTGDAEIQLRFRRVDMDDATEYFNIFDEDSTFIGRTPHTNSECGDITMMLTLPQARLSDWLNDGFIELRFVSNPVPGIPRAEINGFCGGSIQTTVSFEIDLTNAVEISYTLGLNEPLSLEGADTVDLNLGAGSHELTFYYKDCALNEATCQMNINVIDVTSPQMVCPQNKTFLLPDNRCNDTISVLLNEIMSTDVCNGNYVYDRKAPLSNEASLITFIYNDITGTHIARNKQFLFDNVIPVQHRDSPVILTLEFNGENNDNNLYFDLLAPDGTTVGSTSVRNDTENCGFTSAQFVIGRNSFNNWILNNQISFTAVPNNVGDGINPCIPIPQNQTTDGISTLRLRLQYNDFAYAYQLSGATTSGLINVAQQKSKEDIFLKAGTTSITLFTGDANGNKGSCSFDIEMKDQTKPVAKCKNAAVNIHPSGIEPTSILVSAIDNGSFDLCSNVFLTLRPDQVSCAQVNSDVTVTLIAQDEGGNKDSCLSLVRIKPFELKPYFSSGLCENDSLKLFANLPPTMTPGAYTFLWNGPNNFEFFVENPTIPDIDESYNGLYTVSVTGFNNCITEGSVIVNVQPLKNPVLTSSAKTFCEGEDIILTATQFSGNVTYEWFEGIAPTGVKIATTSVPDLVLQPLGGVHFYYVIVRGTDCSSSPSALLKVTAVKKPVAMIEKLFYSVCEGETVQLSSTNTGNDITYFWSGPNFTSNIKTPPPFTNIMSGQQGEYSLVVSRENCDSDTVIATVIVLERPEKPEISSASVFCEGATFSLLVNNVINADRYEWYLNGQLRFSTLENNLTITNVQPNFEGNWHVVVVKGSCISAPSEQKAIAIDDLLEIGVTNSGPICAGDSVQLQTTFVPNATYTWSGPDLNFQISSVYNPKTLAFAGYYSVTITTPTGCQNNAGTTVEIITPPVITALSSDVTPCMDGVKPIIFSPSVFPQNALYTFEWTSTNGFTSNLLQPVINNPMQKDTGVYTLIVYNEGCPSIPFAISVRFFMIPPTPEIIGPQFYCEGDSITLISSIELSGQNPKYFWTTPVFGQQTTNENFIGLGIAASNFTGNYTLIIEENGCSSLLSLPFEMEVRPRPSIPEVSASSPVCFGSDILLTSDFADVEYNWTGPEIFFSNQSMPEIKNVSEKNEGWYVLSVSKNGCASTLKDSVFVEIEEQIKNPVIVGERFFLCKSSPSFIELCLDPNTINPGSFTTLINVMTGDTVAKFNSLCTMLTHLTLGLQTGSNFIYAVVSENGCHSSPSNVVVVELDIAPNVQAASLQGDEVKICEGNTISLESVVGPPQVDLKWTSFNPGLIISDPERISTTISNLQKGNNTIILQFSFRGCVNFSTDTITIIVEGYPESNDDGFTVPYFSNSQLTVLQNDFYTSQVNIKIIEPPVEGTIKIEEGSIVYSSSFNSAENVEFIYEICSDFCPDLCSRSTVFVQIDVEKDCRPPNIITPNEDGINDAFLVPCLFNDQFPENRLVIFNEWGNEVYSAKNYNNDWQGLYNGNPLPAGTYFYVLDLGNDTPALNGFLILQR
ncbi:MAG: gliding motility-associated C-terminal domain-containing protein [Saprospiraceae bacterium]|nr:gliding motility-associated C-terminal domain-containing protein [Saprospiraceae bacterium]